MDKFDTVVFIGRFQPLHNGHLEVIKQAFERANKRVMILVGSVNGPRTFKNPFTFEQRAKVIQEVVHSQQYNVGKGLVVMPAKDYRYNNAGWIENVQKIVAQYTPAGESVAIIGFHKDDSSQYLDWFPQWKYVPVKLVEDAAVVDATTVRNILFEGLNPGFVKGVLPSASYNFLQEFTKTAEYDRIKDEYEVIKAYKKSWESAPYAPTFVCADAVVVCAGHVLMVERGAQPGKGQWALPGGFLNQNETVKECSIRELIEETQIDIPRKVLEGSIDIEKGGVVFDAPNRSSRGRTITHAFRFNVALDPKGKLPRVKGADDAVKARWIPLSELNEDNIYEDHMGIIDKMIGA